MDSRSTKNKEIRPTYYRGNNGQDVFSFLNNNGLTYHDGTEGFYVGNIIKYAMRYPQKNGLEDIDKLITYAMQLRNYVANKKGVK